MTKKYTSLEHSIRNIFSGDKTGSTENKSMEHNARLIHEAKTNQLTPQKTPGGQSPAYTEHSGFTGVFRSQSQNSSAAANEARRKPYTTGATMTENGDNKKRLKEDGEEDMIKQSRAALNAATDPAEKEKLQQKHDRLLSTVDRIPSNNTEQSFEAGGKKNNKTKKFEEQAAVATPGVSSPGLGAYAAYNGLMNIGKKLKNSYDTGELSDFLSRPAANIKKWTGNDSDTTNVVKPADTDTSEFSKLDYVDTPAPKTDKSIAIGADELDGTKTAPVAPVKTGVTPGAITAPVTSGAASDAADEARSAAKVTSQAQAKAAEASQTAPTETAKPFRFPFFGSGTNTGTTAHSEYHTVPVQTSISQAAKERSFREEYNNAPDYTRRKNSSKELVGRPDSAPLKSAKSVLGRNAVIKAKIIDEEKKMASVIKSVIKKKKEESEGGANPLVDFHPKINHKYDNQS